MPPGRPVSRGHHAGHVFIDVILILGWHGDASQLGGVWSSDRGTRGPGEVRAGTPVAGGAARRRGGRTALPQGGHDGQAAVQA